MKPRLYTNPISPFCRAASIVLAEKAIAFETDTVTTGADRARLREVSRSGQVPVLVVDGETHEGSTAIFDFAEIFAPVPALVPSPPAARMRCLRLEELAHATTDPLQFLVHLVSFRRPELAEQHPSLPERVRRAVGEHYAFLDASFDGEPFLAGTYSRADILLFALVSSLVSMGCPIEPSLGALTGWFERVATRPAVASDAAAAAASEAEQAASDDPFFRIDRVHWRGPRMEWACRFGLARWLADEIELGRAFFSPPPRG